MYMAIVHYELLLQWEWHGQCYWIIHSDHIHGYYFSYTCTCIIPAISLNPLPFFSSSFSPSLLSSMPQRSYKTDPDEANERVCVATWNNCAYTISSLRTPHTPHSLTELSYSIPLSNLSYHPSFLRSLSIRIPSLQFPPPIVHSILFSVLSPSFPRVELKAEKPVPSH